MIDALSRASGSRAAPRYEAPRPAPRGADICLATG
jgi:hypothetical protein